MVVRKAAVAGSFYPRYKPDLLNLLQESFEDSTFGPGEKFTPLNKERTVIGGISPHAGYIYSGCAAAYTYLTLFKEKIPDTIIILGTDHIGYGKIALMEEGEWETPLGNLKIDSKLAKEILNNSSKIISDESAFVGYPFGREHNIEVQLPFIKYCAQDKNVEIVPITVSTKNFEQLDQISNDIAKSISAINKDIVIIASSDMTHKQPRNTMLPKDDLDEMRKKDQLVIDAFVQLDPKKTLKAANNTSVCGPQTITTLILTCKKITDKCKGKALKYYMSYEKGGGTGPCEYSVGYFSGVVVK